MALYHPIRRGGRTVRRWLYITSGLLVIIIVVAYIYSRPSKDEGEVDTNLTAVEQDSEIQEDSITTSETEPAWESEPVLEPEPNLQEIATDFIADPNSKASKLIAEAMELLHTSPSEIIKAREILNDALLHPMSRRQQEFVKAQLSELANKWLFSRDIFPNDRLCGRYEVKRGERLGAICKQYKVPHEILMEINGIKRAETLPAGGTIKIINGPFHARVSRSTFTMDLYLQNTFVQSFRAGLGKEGRQTPTGLWIVKPGGKLENPTWTDPDTGKVYHSEDPDYPLGSVWIELEGLEGDAVGQMGFGIHGTKDPKTIGTASSRGCIRLNNGDAIRVYNMLMPGQSRVWVVE